MAGVPGCLWPRATSELTGGGPAPAAIHSWRAQGVYAISRGQGRRSHSGAHWAVRCAL